MLRDPFIDKTNNLSRKSKQLVRQQSVKKTICQHLEMYNIHGKVFNRGYQSSVWSMFLFRLKARNTGDDVTFWQVCFHGLCKQCDDKAQQRQAALSAIPHQVVVVEEASGRYHHVVGKGGVGGRGGGGGRHWLHRAVRHNAARTLNIKQEAREEGNLALSHRDEIYSIHSLH